MASGDGGLPSGFLSARQALALVGYGDPSALDGSAQGEPDKSALESVDDRTIRLDEADRTLCAAIMTGALPVFGRRGSAASGMLTSLEHEAVPPTFFLNCYRTLNMSWGWAALRGDAPMDEWALWRQRAAPDWGDLQFPKAIVLALVPPPLAEPSRKPAGALDSGPPEAAALPPKLSDLPARWTLLECLAWVMSRDTRIVRDASLETPREATTYWAETRVPGGITEPSRLIGEPGYSRLRLTLAWAFDRAQGSAPPGLEPGAAEADLLVKLRSGAITARGRTATNATPQDIDPGDWRGLALVERAGGEVTTEPERMTGQAWRDVTIARDAVVRVWEPFGDTPLMAAGTEALPEIRPVPEIVGTGTAGRPTSMHLIRPEHARRLTSGEAHISVSAEASHLAAWFGKAYPRAPQPTAKAIENKIRDHHRNGLTAPPK